MGNGSYAQNVGRYKLNQNISIKVLIQFMDDFGNFVALRKVVSQPTASTSNGMQK